MASRSAQHRFRVGASAGYGVDESVQNFGDDADEANNKRHVSAIVVNYSVVLSIGHIASCTGSVAPSVPLTIHKQDDICMSSRSATHRKEDPPILSQFYLQADGCADCTRPEDDVSAL